MVTIRALVVSTGSHERCMTRPTNKTSTSDSKGALQKAISAPLLYKNYSTMPGNKPLTREEFRAYMKERDRKLKAYDTAERTVKVMYCRY